MFNNFNYVLVHLIGSQLTLKMKVAQVLFGIILSINF